LRFGGREGKAALARTHSKTCRRFGSLLGREASWSSAEEQNKLAVRLACSLSALMAGNINPASMAMTAITTSISINVKPRRNFIVRE
jgi:hypothetical protein